MNAMEYETALASLCGEYKLARIARAVQTQFFTLVGTVVIPATTTEFVAKNKFFLFFGKAKKGNVRVKIDSMSESFIQWFLLGNGKTEAPIRETTLSYVRLKKPCSDISIIAGLCGRERAETTLTEMFSLMDAQRNGEFGALFNGGYGGRTNIFFIPDQEGVLRTVALDWGCCGWSVRATSLLSKSKWHAGTRVFSRNIPVV